jgi:hypothetical protein
MWKWLQIGGCSFLRRGFAGSFVLIKKLCGENLPAEKLFLYKRAMQR